MRRRRLILALFLGILLTGTAIYTVPRFITSAPLSNNSSEPRSLSDLINFTKIANLKESILTPLSPDWESALATLQQYPGTIPVYTEACSKYSCPGGVPISLSTTPQTLLPQKPTPTANDHFGYVSAAVGNNILIGIFPYDPNTFLPNAAGAVELFDSNGNLLTMFQDPAPDVNDGFGQVISSYGNNVLIGAYNATFTGIVGAGAAYLFDSNGNLLKTFHEPTPTANDFFGASVAGANGNIIVGASSATVGGLANAGAAYLFNPNGNLLATYHEPTPALDAFFGRVISVGGNVLIGAINTTVSGIIGAGAAYLFDSSGNLLTTYHEPTPATNDRLKALANVGGNILLSSRATVNGLLRAGAAYLFDTSGNLLKTLHEPTSATNNQFGFSGASVSGNILIGSPFTTVAGLAQAGAAYLFDKSGNLLATLQEPNPIALNNFGWSVAGVGVNILATVPVATVRGNSQAGTTYLFDGGGTLLKTLQETIRSMFGSYGFSIGGVGSNLLVGDPFDGPGTVYVLDSSGNIIRNLQKPTPVNGDWFGWAVAGVGANIIVGAPRDRTIALRAGAAFLYDTSGSLLATIRKPGPALNDTFGFSVAAVGNNILVGAPGNATGGFANAGAAYLYDSNFNLLASYREPVPAAQARFGNIVAGVGGNVLVGAPLGFSKAGAAYLFDSKGNLLTTFHEPTPSANNRFGSSVAGAAGGILIGATNTTVAGFVGAGAAYVFDTSGTLLKTFQEPTPGTGYGFGSVAGAAGSLVIGSSNANVGGAIGAGAAYAYDSNGNLLKTFHEPTPSTGDGFGWSVFGVGGGILIGSPFGTIGGLFQDGAAYFFRQFALRDACAIATGSDCVVLSEIGSFQAGPSTVAMNVVAVSLRSARNATLGTQMALTVMCNKEVTDARIACSALYIDGNVWGPAREALTKGPFIIVNAQSYFFLQWHWYDPANQRIVAWSYWWYGTTVAPNWYWNIYLWWRTYTANNLGAWTPWWWWWWHWTYYQYWSFWTTGLPAS